MRPASKDRRKKLRQFRDIARQQQNNLCFYCKRRMIRTGTPEARLEPQLVETIEHRKPRSKGGTDNRANLVLTCRACNTAKASLNEQAFLAECGKPPAP